MKSLTPDEVDNLVASHDHLLHAMVSLVGKLGGEYKLSATDLLITPRDFSLEMEMEQGGDAVTFRIIGREDKSLNGIAN